MRWQALSGKTSLWKRYLNRDLICKCKQAKKLLGGGEEGSTFPIGKIASAKALRQEMACHTGGTEKWLMSLELSDSKRMKASNSLGWIGRAQWSRQEMTVPWTRVVAMELKKEMGKFIIFFGSNTNKLAW